jgi:HEAT repeat protein
MTRLLALALVTLCGAAPAADDPPDVFSVDMAQYVEWSQSPHAELRISALRSFAYVAHHSAEPHVLALATDPEPEVRREVAYALARVGSIQAIEPLLNLAEDADAGVRSQARTSLRVLTQADEPTRELWESTTPDAYADALFEQLATERRGAALEALRCFARPQDEPAILAFVTGAQPPANGEEQALAIRVLERIGTEAALPWLDSVSQSQPTAAWALGEIGGPAAEEALLKGLGRFGTVNPQHLINLDRLHSTRCGPFAALLIHGYGCITFRGDPENLMYDPEPGQRASTNLLIRAGRAEEIVDLVLREMESRADDASIPEDLRQSMVRLREELAPGFVRNDGVTTSQPMTAMSHLVRDRSLAPRIIPLLDHDAYVARVYAAMALGRLHAIEALPAITAIIDEGYPFADATTAVSGKHFGDSQSVRWRGFLCMALGRMGGERARVFLEGRATDPGEYRDIRIGAVVGLGFIGSDASVPALRRVADEDIVWRTRVEAERVLHEMELGVAG